MITDIIFLIIYFYIIPFIIVIVGYYIDFEGETLGEFKEDMFFMDEHDYDPPASKFMQSTIPGINIMVAFIFLVIGIYRCIKFPFKIINKKFDIWNKIKNLKIKKHI